MNAFKRAWRYITRKPTKTVLLVVTFFLIGNLVILGLGVSQAAENAKILTRQRMRAAVSYEVDYDAFWQYASSIEDADEQEEAYNHYPRVDKTTALNIAQDERVRALNFLTNTTGYAKDFDYVHLNNEYEENNRGTETVYVNGEEVPYVEPNIMVYATGTANMIELEEGTFTVTSGSYFSQSDLDSARRCVLITEQMAEQNGLRVGDTIRLSMVDSWASEWLTPLGRTLDEFDLELEITGIFNNANTVDPSSDYFRWMSPFENPQNIILIPLSLFTEYQTEIYRLQFSYYQSTYPEWGYTEETLEEQLANLDTPNRVVYLLSDPLDVDDFVADHKDDLAQYTMLNANNDQFRKMARPLDTMSFFANFVVWIVVINAVVIITLITALTLKTREYEIGVLLSIGVSKVKIVLQLFLELILIALVGFTLAVASGSLIAGRVGEAVLSYQVDSDAQYAEEGNPGYYYYGDTNYFTEVTQEELLSEYEVSISPKLVGEIYILGAGVVLIAILIPSVMIMRLNPKQILLEQN